MITTGAINQYLKQTSTIEEDFMGTNIITLFGRCGKDPTIETVGGQNTKKGAFSLGVSRPPRKKGDPWPTDWFICEGFLKTADKIEEKLRKGDLVAVCGSMEVQSWDASDGSGKRYKNVVHINWPDNIIIEPKESDISQQEPATPEEW